MPLRQWVYTSGYIWRVMDSINFCARPWQAVCIESHTSFLKKRGGRRMEPPRSIASIFVLALSLCFVLARAFALTFTLTFVCFAL